MMRSVCALSVSLFAITFAPRRTRPPGDGVVSSEQPGFNASFFGSDNCSAASMSVYRSRSPGNVNGEPLTDPPTTYVVIDYQKHL